MEIIINEELAMEEEVERRSQGYCVTHIKFSEFQELGVLLYFMGRTNPKRLDIMSSRVLLSNRQFCLH